ncbi:MAG: hypothetical protein ACTSX8_10610 [Alphaproteobacteria bacterium]
MKIYLATSWRNPEQPVYVDKLLTRSHEVYDFRNPRPGDTGFRWSQIDPDWGDWAPHEFIKGLDHAVAMEGFDLDLEAMNWADVFVMLNPCGRSAHLEAGWAVGAGKPLAIVLDKGRGGGNPELMYRLAYETGGKICAGFRDLEKWLESLK